MGSNSAELTDRVLVGTCGYSYPGEPPQGWSGVFYPRGGKKRVDELEFYAGYFNTQWRSIRRFTGRQVPPWPMAG